MTRISKSQFKRTLLKLGTDPRHFEGKALRLEHFCEVYEMEEAEVLDAIEEKRLKAHYDYTENCIWVDALEAAHYYFCLQNKELSRSRFTA